MSDFASSNRQGGKYRAVERNGGGGGGGASSFDNITRLVNRILKTHTVTTEAVPRTQCIVLHYWQTVLPLLAYINYTTESGNMQYSNVKTKFGDLLKDCIIKVDLG